MMMLEKLEECSVCGEVKRWLYDSQICCACGYGDPQRGAAKPHDCMEETQEFRLRNDQEWKAKVDYQRARAERAEAERDRYLDALAWIAAYNTDVSARHAPEWLRDVVSRAREALQTDLPSQDSAPLCK